MNWECVVSMILAVGFGIATIILGVKRAEKKKPVWGYDMREIIGLGSEAPTEVKLSYNDNEVKDVYRTVVIFFNKGTKPIEEKDIAKKIVVDFGDGKILKEPTLITRSKEENNFSVNRVGGNRMELKFNYLGHNDGGCIEVMHTRGSLPSIEGTIIDSPIKEITGFSEDIECPGIIRTVITGVALVGVVVYFGLEAYSAFTNVGETWAISRLVLYVGAGVVGIILGEILRYDLPKMIRGMKFPSWGREISKTIIERKIAAVDEPIFIYCRKCRKRVEIVEPKSIRMSSGRVALKGKCAECKSTVVFIVGR